jgi:hypothetical protein
VSNQRLRFSRASAAKTQAKVGRILVGTLNLFQSYTTMKANYTTPSLFFFLLLFAAAGCGGSQRPEGLPPTYPLTIRVLQEGKPLEDATVSLVSLEVKWVIGGRTNASGEAKMMTHGKYDGAPEGNFNVMISKTLYEGRDEYDAAMTQGDTAAAQKIDVKAFQYVEDKYTLAKETPVKVEVKRDSKLLEVDAGPAVKIKKEFLR